jgi:hypothetical protein
MQFSWELPPTSSKSEPYFVPLSKCRVTVNGQDIHLSQVQSHTYTKPVTSSWTWRPCPSVETSTCKVKVKSSQVKVKSSQVKKPRFWYLLTWNVWADCIWLLAVDLDEISCHFYDVILTWKLLWPNYLIFFYPKMKTNIFGPRQNTPQMHLTRFCLAPIWTKII